MKRTTILDVSYLDTDEEMILPVIKKFQKLIKTILEEIKIKDWT